MKIEFILLLFLKIIYSFQINPFFFRNFYLLNDQEYMPLPELRNKTIKLFSLIIKHINEIHDNNTNFTKELEEKFPIDDDYLNLIEEIYLVDENDTISERTEYFYLKTFLDSSKSKYDLSTYSSCVERKFLYNLSNILNQNINDTLYYMITIDATNNIDITNITYENFYYNFGVCFPNLNPNNSDFDDEKKKNWTEKNFKNLFLRINHMFYNISNLNYDKNAIYQINISTIYNKNIQNKLFNNKIKTFSFWFSLFPLFFFILFLFVNIHFTYDNCFYKNNDSIVSRDTKITSLLKNEEEEEDDNNNNNNKYSIYYILKYSFNLHSNFNELFKFDNKYSIINNEKGIVYIKGLRGISIIFLIFGMLTMMLYNSECSQIGGSSLKNYFTSYFYPIFFIGIRYSPRVLFCCSGFTLAYKLLCFLDNRCEENWEYNNINIIENETKDNNNITNSDLDNNNSSYNNDYIKNNIIDIKCSKFLYFILEFYKKQIHKYFIFLFTIFFLRYSLYNFVSFLNIKLYNGNGPLWENFGWTINKTNIKDLFLSSFIILPFFYEEGKNFLIYLWLVYNEFLFFIISSIIIFIGYKCKLKIDILFYLIIFIISIIKLIIFIIGFQKNNRNKNTNLYLYLNNYGYVLIIPFYNYVYYIFGMIIGMVNYTIQKGIDNNIEEKKLNETKPYLKSIIIFMKIIKNYINNKYFKCIFFILIILLSFVFPLIFNIYIFKNGGENIYKNTFYNIYLLFDIEIVTFLLFIISFIYYISPMNFINNFLSHNIWSIGDKLYLTLITQINLITLYIFYQSETTIIFNTFNCILYSFLTSFVAFISTCFVYILIELPFKKMIIINKNNFEEVEKFILYEKEKKIK